MQTKILLEVAVFTPESALIAAKAGADRIELCSGYPEGGLSPAASTIKQVRKSVDCYLHVMVRPRIGDFLYTEYEKQIILDEIKYCKSINIDGVVVGALTTTGDIDENFISAIKETAYPMSVTFHRAFDISRDLFFSMDKLISCGIDRILTSGGENSAFDGRKTIAKLIKRAAGKIIVLPGGGITAKNVTELLATTKASEIHFSGKHLMVSRMNKLSKIKLSTSIDTDEYNWFECDYDIVKNMTDILKTGDKTQ